MILDKDTDVHFPHFTVLKASAGSGKTYTLTERYAQFLLSERVPRNGLRNILAITFSNNAAKEMKERVLKWLQSVYFGEEQSVRELSRIVSVPKERMIEKAGLLIDEILSNYSDFQVRTIDSFMTTVFKASAIDFGYNPEFDILMNSDAVMEYSFDLFLRKVREGTPEAALFDEIIDFILGNKKKDASYLWDPSAVLLDEIKKIYKKLAATGKRPLIEDHSREIAILKMQMQTAIQEIEALVERSGLERSGRSSYRTVLPLVREGRFADLMGKGLATPPVNKARKTGEAALQAYGRIIGMWSGFGEIVRRYTSLYVRSCYAPYLKVYEEFSETVETIKRHQGKVFIEDINRNLAEYLDAEIVPDVYFRIGETVFHFLIDEFQDTSPVQWRNLFPLIENSLSQMGSAFVVGDTKQAIYGFRNADYTIMKGVEKRNPFPSSQHEVKELDTNFRSLRKILDFSERVFKEKVCEKADYRAAGERSGLTDYVQKAREGSRRPGYSEVKVFEKDDDDPPEMTMVQDLVSELKQRGYAYGDIAILTQKNEDAVKATVWLNEKDVPFISYSSLDIRRRKITGEIVSLLNFLDSPTDDLSFSVFLLGEIFTRTLAREAPEHGPERLRDFIFAHRDERPLYKSFRKEFGGLWERYFSGLFRSSGYFPLYDLVTAVFSAFRVFDILEDEEATLVKVLEVVKDFEGEGYNSLGDFLDFAGNGDDSAWNMDVPKGVDAVKVMTIHKAKGLGFPVVVLLLYEDRNRGFDYILDEGREGVRLLKITRETMSSDPDFERLYREESVKDRVNRLNSLYVGFTRPKEELYVIAVKGRNDGYPFDLLPDGLCSSSEKTAKVESFREVRAGDFEISHHHNELKFPAGADEMISIEERRRGEFIHRVLSVIEYAEEGHEERLPDLIGKVGEETGADYEVDDIMKPLMSVIDNEEVSDYFRRRPGRDVWTEKEFADSEGNLYRMDRVVRDPGRIVVIDYKTGNDRISLQKHEAQMRNYMRILSGIFPDAKPEGIIAYVDSREIRRVR